MIKYIWFLAILAPSLISSKVIIATSAYNRTDFIEWQDKTFKKFVKDDYEFVVFNDARDNHICSQIEETCRRLNLRCIRFPQHLHNKPYMHREPWEDYNHASVRCSNVVQYQFDTIGFNHDDIFVTLDSDLILVRPISFREHLKDHPISSLVQSREAKGKKVEYMWIGIIFMDIPKLPDVVSFNVNCGVIDGVNVDAGGYTGQYLKNYPEITPRWVNSHGINDPKVWGDFPEHWQNMIDHQVTFIHDFHFAHYYAGSNWPGYSNEEIHERTVLFNQFLDTLINEEEPSLDYHEN